MQEKPAWVSAVEEKRREMGLPTVSKEYSERYETGNSEPVISSSQNKNSTASNLGSPGSSGGSSGYVASDPQGVDNYHAKYTANDGAGMSASDLATLKGYGDAWNDANEKRQEAVASGQTSLAEYYQGLMDKAHRDAEDLRLSYGYYGGEDGSEYNEIPKVPVIIQPQQPQTGDYDLTEYLKQASAAQIEAALANLKGAYEKSMAGYDAKLELLPQTYNGARNNVAAQDAIARKSFDERAVASGLSSGASGQLELARSSAYQRDIAGIDQEQANATSAIELEKANLQAEYEAAIAAAKSEGDAALAEALYQELIRVQMLEREDAQLAAAQEAAAQELALKYGAELSGTTTDKTGTPKADTPINPGKGYDNGKLTANQVKQMQAFYGLAQDGMWGPNSQATTGLSADAAWTQYLYQKYSTNPDPATGHKDTSAYWSSFGSTQPPSTARTTLLYDAGKNMYTWNGVSYGNMTLLLNAMSAANLTEQEKATLKQEFDKLGYEITFD